jgi:hypothetical protein
MGPMSDKYTGEIDPDIAALLGGSPAAPAGPAAPQFTDLFGGVKPDAASPEAVDLNKTTFAPITAFTQPPRPYFDNPGYYKTVLADVGEPAARVHKIFTDLMNAQDAETRGQNRLRFIPAWWDFLESLVRSLGPGMPEAKRLAIRYGILLPSLMSPEQKTNMASIVFENNTGEAVHYVDEWLMKVGSGEVAPLATDEEVKTVKKGAPDNAALQQKLEKAQGQFQAQSNLIATRIKEMMAAEDSLIRAAQTARQHEKHGQFPQLLDTLTSSQRSALGSMNEQLRAIASIDREVTVYFRDLEKLQNEVQLTQQKLSEAGGASLDARVAVKELGSIRQIAKMQVGRQGNHFPVVMKQYLPPRLEDISTRENVIKLMTDIERLDPGLFHRTFKNTVNRIVPHVILTPSFGDTGVCWEPFEKYNRSTSRGRISIPMYSKNLKLAVLTGLADLRWQVVKEKAGFRWMEEGLSGWYYQWFSEQGYKGDVKESFVQDYIVWITKESEGNQKLDKDVRGIFWRNTPFPQELRESLKNRGFVYSELYKKDLNRALSDGY